LNTPQGGSVRAIRMEFITRLYFFRLFMPEKISQAFEKQRLETKSQLSRLGKKYAKLPEHQIYNRMSLEMRLRELKTVLEWLDDYQKNALI
jgi:hypothetical protein